MLIEFLDVSLVKSKDLLINFLNQFFKVSLGILAKLKIHLQVFNIFNLPINCL